MKSDLKKWRGLAIATGLLLVGSFAAMFIIDSQTARAGIPAAGVPIDCLMMNTAPTSTFQDIGIRSKSGQTAHFSVEIADTGPKQEQGLMCRADMDDSRGMLFEFDKTDEHKFWMRNTLIALDIIFIGPDGRIVSIARNAKPLDETPLPSGGPVDGVLEINAGLSAKLGLKPGDVVIHPFFKTQ